MEFYKKFMLFSNIVITIIFMIPIIILCINIINLNFNFQEMKYSLAGSIIEVVYIIVSWRLYRLQN